MERYRTLARTLGGTVLRQSAGLATLVLTGGAAALIPIVARAQAPGAAVPLVLDGVTVIDVERGQRLGDHRVVIVGNRIQAVGARSTVSLPPGAQVVDARSKYLIPGLWDMHIHPQKHTRVFYPLLLANGVTGFRDAWSAWPLDSLVRWRREILAGSRVGPPRQLFAGRAFNQVGCVLPVGHICANSPVRARYLVDSLKAAGADMIKGYGLDRAMYFTIAAAARRVGLPFGGHLSQSAATAIEASDSGVRIIDHAAGLNRASGYSGDLEGRCWGSTASVERCRQVAERFRRNGTWWVPTLGRGTHADTIKTRLHQRMHEFWPDSVYMYRQSGRHQQMHDSLVARRDSLLPRVSPREAAGDLDIVHRAGLPLLAATDGGDNVVLDGPIDKGLPGFQLHAELAIYVAEGLTPLEALQAATLNPAQYLRGTDSLGTIAPGKLADLVLLDADPLAAIANTTAIRAVVANGRYFDRAALDEILAEVRRVGPVADDGDDMPWRVRMLKALMLP